MAVPVRGTQSFVGVMAAVWKRPSLTGLEIAWRWAVGVMLLTLYLLHAGAVSWREYQVFGQLVLHHGYIFGFDLHRFLASVWVWALVGGLYSLGSTIGRTAVLRRLDTTLRLRRMACFVLNFFRYVLLAAFWVLWAGAVLWSKSLTQVSAIDLDLVPFAALAICITLALYVTWALLSWPLQLAPLLAMREGFGPLRSLRMAFAANEELRSKLIETNLVMCIVKIALLVLAMVFSASPLAFTAITTPVFLGCWWTAAVLLYFVASDYFHVVRAAAYLEMMRAYEICERDNADSSASLRNEH